ncbi:MAG: glutamine-hydrolyzing GMP synthase [Planctomycetota bacterium]
MSQEKILVLDFGSQYAQLIARRVRELKVYAEIVAHDVTPDEVRARGANGLILSGGPASVLDEGAPLPDRGVFDMDLPVLGICYGMQAMAHLLGGRVEAGDRREYGPATIAVIEDCPLFEGLPKMLDVWMSHGDRVVELPEGFELTARSGGGLAAATADGSRKLFGLQFHPEVVHTPRGKDILRNFLYGPCGCTGDWTMESFVDSAIASIREQVAGGRVLCGISGGVDSAVCAALCHRAVGERLDCVFVDNGLLRKGEVPEVSEALAALGVRLHVVDAIDGFLRALEGLVDPEEKRRAIGTVFIDVFERESGKLGRHEFLAQGTLYPDVIESTSPHKGPSATIKSHHNVGGLPEKLGFELVEPLRYLFKDEVRRLGRALGLPVRIVERQPFPGPGLAVRILGDVTRERLALLRRADAIVREEIGGAELPFEVWQYFCVLLPVQTVGVMGDERTYENVVAVRAVTSEDGMTADWAKLPHDLLARMSSRIVNEVKGVNRIVYDVTSKPPGTIEWE